MPQVGVSVARTRREFLWQAGGQFAALPLLALLSQDGFLAQQARAADGVSAYTNPLAPKAPHFTAKAKSVIFLFMYGGPSHIDTFDYKPDMYGMDGKTVDVKTFGRGGHKNKVGLSNRSGSFEQYGECGKWISDLFPHLGSCVDDIAFLHSMTADSPIHGSAMLMMNSGKILSGSPALGSWVNYGLGSENENLPAFVVMLDRTGGPDQRCQELVQRIHARVVSGGRDAFGRSSDSGSATAGGHEPPTQRALLDRLTATRTAALKPADGQLPSWQPGSPAMSWPTRCNSTLPKRSTCRTRRRKRSNCTDWTIREREDFARKCILARRLVERGVRFIQIYSGGNHNDANWDAHGDLVKNHNFHAGNTDQPIAGLLKDLKRRESTGRNTRRLGRRIRPPADGGVCRRARAAITTAYGFTMWLAGGGIRGGHQRLARRTNLGRPR